MKHLHWLIPVLTSQDIPALKNYSLASIRLRCYPSIRAAANLGWTFSYGEDVPLNSSILIVGKIGSNNLSSRQPHWIKQIAQAQKNGKVYMDYTDHHLGFKSEMFDFYRQVLSLIDGAITPSLSMEGLLSQIWVGHAVCIRDPIEIALQSPKMVAGNPITLLWFGHPSNIQFLIDFLRVGFQPGDQIRLIILSNEAGLNYFVQSPIISAAQIEIQMALWSFEAMAAAAKHADACIIPSNLTSPQKIGASSNRLLTALALGLPVAADNVMSYLDFSDSYCDIRSHEFRDFLKNPLMFKDKIENAQNTVLPSYQMNSIEKDWEQFLKN